uniref:Piwi domain-containing protein n=1 Tax=Panagrolaimus sp. ES5 TaxID=591445 RepID=A0AC34FD98_9BILA
GTTKPPKYRVVHGMRNYKVDNLLAIVYQLCRLNPQAKQSFRRPAPIGLASKLLDRIVEKCPTIFDGKDEDIQNLMSHPDFKNISYYI